MGSSVVQPSLTLAVVLVVLACVAVAAGSLSGLGQQRPVLVAVLRAAVQLAVVSTVLLALVESLWGSAAFVLLMLGVASSTAAGRASGLPLRAPGAARRVGLLALAVAGGAVPVTTLVLASGTVPFEGVAIVPVAGILIGGAMTVAGLAGQRMREELRARRGEVEAGLALGLLQRDAVLEVARPVAATAMAPQLDQTRTVGLVALPGAFVGVLLGGGTPVEAGAAQLLVLVGLLAAQVVAVWIVVELVGRRLLLPEVASADG